MCYVRNNQGTLKTDKWCDLKDAADRGKTETSTAGKRIILSSYTGGPRYMIQNFQNAMSICKYYSYPYLFITMTCNPKWPEVVRFLEENGLRSEDRLDILCRVFKMKLDRLIKDLKDKMIFGKVDAMTYTVEFQKRGLPRAHILLFLSREIKLPNSEDNFALIEIEKLLQMNGSSLSRFSTMPLPEDSLVSETNNRMIYEELSYDSVELQEEYENRCLSLTEEQKEVQQQIMEVVSSESGGVLFLYDWVLNN
ncbi:hypothetical protein ACS0TY_027406 [Phlomoides rotata]